MTPLEARKKHIEDWRASDYEIELQPCDANFRELNIPNMPAESARQIEDIVASLDGKFVLKAYAIHGNTCCANCDFYVHEDIEYGEPVGNECALLENGFDEKNNCNPEMTVCDLHRGTSDEKLIVRDPLHVWGD